jgi:hypothetical protein
MVKYADVVHKSHLATSITQRYNPSTAKYLTIMDASSVGNMFTYSYELLRVWLGVFTGLKLRKHGEIC